MSRYSPEYLTSMQREPMSLNFVKQAIKDKAILEARVIKRDENNTLTVELGKGIFGYIPFEELEYTDGTKQVKEIAACSKVNKHIKFIPKELTKTDDGYMVLCSRKEAQKECIDNFISKLLPGDVIDARVLKVVNYGIFCDIGCGVTALLPTNNISVTHIVNPTELFSKLKRMKVVVAINDNPFRIQLSHKELLGTWEEEASKFKEGDIVPGMVLSVEDYGIFVRLSQNLSGLASLTELSIKTGDLVSVQVINVKPENMKIKLNIQERIEFDTDEEYKQAKQMKFQYTKTEGNVKRWVYSTETAKKQIVSEF